MQTSEGKVRNASEYESPNCDFGRYSQGEVALDVKHEKNDDSRCLNEYVQWLWTPN